MSPTRKGPLAGVQTEPDARSVALNQAEAGPAPARKPIPIAERIAAALRAEILTGRYRAGDRLPSERELAERFGTHRGAVREALKKLEQLGVAEVRRGGARALPFDQASFDIIPHLLALESPPDPQLFDQVFEVFGGLFSLSARLGAERATDAQRARVAEIVEDVSSRRLTPQLEQERIYEMHAILAEASGNPIVDLARRAVRSAIDQYIEHPETLLRPPDDERETLLRRMADAFAQGDGAATADASYELLRAVRRNAVEILTEERARLGLAPKGFHPARDFEASPHDGVDPHGTDEGTSR